MKYSFLIFFFLILQNCSKPKTVLICGDHICVNKKEAESFFEENLTIEVKIIDSKEKKDFNLVELNLKDNRGGIKKVTIAKKSKTNKEVKTLSNREIKNIKKNLKLKSKREKSTTKTLKGKKKNDVYMSKIKKRKKITIRGDGNIKPNIIKNNIVDVCTKIEKCNINEISKYLLKQGKNKDFPNITARE